MQDIALVTQIGRGGYGKVYHGKYNGQDVAVKVSQAWVPASHDRQTKGHADHNQLVKCPT